MRLTCMLLAFGLLACSVETIVASRTAERDSGRSGENLDAGEDGSQRPGSRDAAGDRKDAASDASGVDASLGDAGCADDSGCIADAFCRFDRDCEPDEYCERSSCNVDRGTCRLRPTLCGSELLPVCGCDGLTYFNDCLRRANGVSLRDDEECGRSAQRCDGPGTCPGDAHCGSFVFRDSECSDDEARRRCWVLPASCDGQSDSGDRFRSCDGTLSCVDGCVAIRSELPVQREDSCPDGDDDSI